MKTTPKFIRWIAYAVSALILPPLPGIVIVGLLLFYGDRRTAKRAAIVTVVAALVVMLSIAGRPHQAQAASYRQCNGVTYGDNVQFYNITTRNITCTYARRLAREWEDVSPLAAGKTRLRGFDCRARQTGFTLDVRCTGDVYVVHFHVTADN